MKYVFGSLCLRSYAAFGEGNVGRNLRVQVMAYHDHVEQLGLGVDAER